MSVHTNNVSNNPRSPYYTNKYILEICQACSKGKDLLFSQMLQNYKYHSTQTFR